MKMKHLRWVFQHIDNTHQPKFLPDPALGSQMQIGLSTLTEVTPGDVFPPKPKYH